MTGRDRNGSLRVRQDVSPKSHTASSLLFVTFTATVTLGAACTPLPESCEAVVDHVEADALSTTIEIRNVGAVPLFVPEAGGDRHELLSFTVDGVQMIDELAFPDLRCSTVEEVDAVCADDGMTKASERLVRLDPGASIEIDWDGYLWELVPLDLTCFDDPLCDPSSNLNCEAGRSIESGSQLSLRSFFATSCSIAGAECTCPQGESACEIPIDVSGDQPELGDPQPTVTVDLEYTGAPIVIEIGG